ncbi:MAG: glycosyltransferase family 4 protein [Planctomycetes bacterium]|nr:glycosyltransferase family 4 protein [Planctomycetota bacterium]
MQRLHVAILDEELPFPMTSGKRIRTFQLLSRLAERHRITYLCHRNPDAEEGAQAETAFRKLGIRTIVVDRQVPAKSGLRFYARLAANLLSPLPYSVTSHCSASLHQAANRLSEVDPPDLWHCEWTPYANYLRHLQSTRPWVVMAHNVETLIWQRYHETEANPLKRWFIHRQFRKFERFEKWAYSSCNRALAVSELDARLMHDRFGAQKISVVDNGVDTAYFEPTGQEQRDPYRILFLGSLDWRPNLDGVRVLLDEIFPSVRQKEPRASLQIVGRRPAEWLRQAVVNRPGVELHADVADVRPFLRSAGMLAVPLRFGGGSRLKILEALVIGLPVVTTRVGVEGLCLEPNHHVTVADDSVEFSKAVLDTMRHPLNSQKQAERGRSVVLERYDWNGLADQLETVWFQTVGIKIPLPNQLVPSLV